MKSNIKVNTDEELVEYRIKRLERQSDMMQKMTKHPLDGSDALFENYSTLITVCALIGFNNDAYCENFLEQPMGEAVQRQFFQKDQRSMMDLIAIAREKDVNVLKSCQKYDVFSAYAAAGFDILCKKLDAETRDWTDSKSVNECALILSEMYLSQGNDGGVDEIL